MKQSLNTQFPVASNKTRAWFDIWISGKIIEGRINIRADIGRRQDLRRNSSQIVNNNGFVMQNVSFWANKTSGRTLLQKYIHVRVQLDQFFLENSTLHKTKITCSLIDFKNGLGYVWQLHTWIIAKPGNPKTKSKGTFYWYIHPVLDDDDVLVKTYRHDALMLLTNYYYVMW